MRISCSSLFLWDYHTNEIIEILTRAGIDSIEFWPETPEFWMHRHEPDAIEQLKKTISVLTDHCTVHAPILDLNASSYNEHVCKATIMETLWTIDLSSMLEASILTIHPGHRTVHRAPTPMDKDRFFHYLSVCIEYASQVGITLALENMTRDIRSMCYDVAGMSEVLLKYPDLMITLDIAHALYSGKDTAMEFIHELGDRIVNVHSGDIHNSAPHYPLYLYNTPDTTNILEELANIGYDNDLTIEIDDKLLDGYQSRQDKTLVLINEKDHLKRILYNSSKISKY
ncbi:MAG: sugar phosphate isomerase/epimerase [Methanosarcinales archaeon]|nr:sugar phosphate isomerase/epimerase [Methanosarcinales archaeon]